MTQKLTYYQQNKEKRIQYQRNYYYDNKDKISKYNKSYYDTYLKIERVDSILLDESLKLIRNQQCNRQNDSQSNQSINKKNKQTIISIHSGCYEIDNIILYWN